MRFLTYQTALRTLLMVALSSLVGLPTAAQRRPQTGSLIDLLNDGPAPSAPQNAGANGNGRKLSNPPVARPGKPTQPRVQLPPIPPNKTVYSLHEIMGELPPTKQGKRDVWSNIHETKPTKNAQAKIAALFKKVEVEQSRIAKISQHFVSLPRGRGVPEGALTLQSLGLAKADEPTPVDHQTEFKNHLRQFWTLLTELGEQLDLLTQPGSHVILDEERYGKNNRGQPKRYDTKRIALPYAHLSSLDDTRRYDARYITKEQAEHSYFSKRSKTVQWIAHPDMITTAAMIKLTGLPTNEVYFDADGTLYRGAKWPKNHSHALSFWPPRPGTEFATSFSELFENVPGYMWGAACYVNRDELPPGTIKKARERVQVYPLIRKDTDRIVEAVRQLASSASTTPEQTRRELMPLLKARIQLARKVGTWIRPLRVHDSSPRLEQNYVGVKPVLERLLGAPLRQLVILEDGSVTPRKPHHRRMPGDFPPSSQFTLSPISTPGANATETGGQGHDIPISQTTLKADMTLPGTMDVPRFGQYQARIVVSEANATTMTGILHLDSIIWRPGTPAEKVGAQLALKGTVYGNGKNLQLTVTDVIHKSQNTKVKITRGEVGVVYRAKLADGRLVGITNPKYSTFYHKNGFSFSIPHEVSSAVKPESTAGHRDSSKLPVAPIAPEYTDKQGIDALLAAAQAGDARAMTVLGWRYFNAVGVTRDDKQAADWFEKATDKGNTRAAHRLANCHWLGRGVKRDVKRMCELNRRAAEQGDILAIGMLIARYHLGVGVERDASAAFTWCQRAAQQERLLGMFQLSYAYETGIGVRANRVLASQWRQKALAMADRENIVIEPMEMELIGYTYAVGDDHIKRDAKKAWNWLHKAWDVGHRGVAVQIGTLYRNGVLGDDFKEAMRWNRIGAEYGYCDSMFNLAMQYEQGIGVEQDSGESFRWFLKASSDGGRYSQSHSDALFMVGSSYLDGIGVEQDDKKAVDYVQRAAKFGNLNAMRVLARQYIAGRGVAANEAEAVRWLKTAAEQGHASSMHALGLAYIDGTSVKQSDEQARKLMEAAARKNYVPAMSHFATMCAEGKGGPTDYRSAVYWFEKAIEAEVHEDDHNGRDSQLIAMAKLGYLYANGLGVIKDFKVAFSWYLKAAQAGLPGAQFTVGRMLMKGIGVPADAELGFRSLLAAADAGIVPAMVDVAKQHPDRGTRRKYLERAAKAGSREAQQLLRTQRLQK